MDVERIFNTFNRHGVNYLLIGGMNMLLRHGGSLTYDIDLWIEDTADNRLRCHQALAELEAAWGADDADWEPISQKSPLWLERQSVFSTLSPAGPIDIFRTLEGLPSWSECRRRAVKAKTSRGIEIPALSDEDLLKCQLALTPQEQKQERIRFLKQVLELP
ncbi:MAG TPA: hypothetical protein VIH42_03555 [Thermoguttaceae bacterium]